MNNSDVLVFLDETKLLPAGGPNAVGFYYNQEKNKRQENLFEFYKTTTEKESCLKKIVRKLPKKIYNFQRLLRSTKELEIMLEENSKYSAPVDFSKYKIIHFHETWDLYKQRNNLQDFKGKIILQSHSPLPTGQERFKDYSDFTKKKIPHLLEKLNKIDEYAFLKADYIIFPCEEAEEPYASNWPFFREFKKKYPKKFRYVCTGINQVYPKKDKIAVRKELKISESDFVVFYAGRHNEVKGYDNLIKIGSEFLKKDNSNWIVVAGREGIIPSPVLNHWLEIGWTTDPHSYISASDIFILPNKVTYFDLVMLEVLSLGKIVLTTRTGGNKFFEKNKISGVFLYDTWEEALKILERIKKMPEENRVKLGEENKKFFLKNLTVEKMYDSYVKILKELLN